MLYYVRMPSRPSSQAALSVPRAGATQHGRALNGRYLVLTCGKENHVELNSQNAPHQTTLHRSNIPITAEDVHCRAPVCALQDVALGARSELQLCSTVWCKQCEAMRVNDGKCSAVQCNVTPVWL